MDTFCRVCKKNSSLFDTKGTTPVISVRVWKVLKALCIPSSQLQQPHDLNLPNYFAHHIRSTVVGKTISQATGINRRALNATFVLSLKRGMNLLILYCTSYRFFRITVVTSTHRSKKLRWQYCTTWSAGHDSTQTKMQRNITKLQQPRPLEVSLSSDTICLANEDDSDEKVSDATIVEHNHILVGRAQNNRE